MDKVMSDKRVIALYVLPALLLIVILVYIPIVMTGYYSLMKWDGIGERTFIALDNYRQLLKDNMFWKSVYHSFLLAVFSVFSLGGYLVVSLILAGKVKGANILRKIYLIPMLLSSVAIAQLWLRIYHPSNGMLNQLLSFLGVEDTPNWLADPSIVLYSVFIPIIWQYAGFYILIYYAALKNIPSSIIEAAIIDGANPWQLAYKIKLPLIAGVIKVTVVLAVVGSLKYFDLIYVMTGGGPNGASEVIASYMYQKAFRSFNFGYGSAIAFSLLILCIAATWLIRKLTHTEEEVQY
ncbi:sugar ABC transporter permease [Anoxybacillus sp. LAT_35]|uniref:carbohydrate ABC transporter permease n=1 Tax=unclassified Anoxybacillus TaxID=2639704 RepID=UPI000509C62B|nr:MULTISPECIES: sugar ABC transporter permease [unclassified Anoxybacillus]MCG5024190.1 sugar ABC transporter permease [Anoxybacillus flavithermus]MCG3086114.1 sugar ABC transporter permease [Anoxybacillus sp. LAT27]MCG6172908.1 sugar ABC transporter permease [Anoxybacillus sp. LAT_11]MCG6173538.1 sugar ABC transporter permease [Anoxybacillus sp. LAT_11]MCG6173900.1 sugar ABC transporter permease [Anoxybacillus sp. LAT_31]